MTKEELIDILDQFADDTEIIISVGGMTASAICVEATEDYELMIMG